MFKPHILKHHIPELPSRAVFRPPPRAPQTYGQGRRRRAYVYEQKRICMYIYIYIYTHISLSLSLSLSLYIYIYIYTHTYTHRISKLYNSIHSLRIIVLHINTYIHVYIYIYIHIYIHMDAIERTLIIAEIFCGTPGNI